MTPTSPTNAAGSPRVALDAVVRAFDEGEAALVARLKAKQPIYAPDAEWNALQGAVSAIQLARTTYNRFCSNAEVSRRAENAHPAAERTQ